MRDSSDFQGVLVWEHHWLMNPGPVLLHQFVLPCKTDPLVEEVKLLMANSTYASIKHPDGRESTVYHKDLAPYPSRASSLDVIVSLEDLAPYPNGAPSVDAIPIETY